MISRLIALATLGTLLSGCYMVPMAFVGPAASGFSTASIMQAGVGIAVKQTTGKSISEHALSALNNNVMKQSYLPSDNTIKLLFVLGSLSLNTHIILHLNNLCNCVIRFQIETDNINNINNLINNLVDNYIEL